MSRWYDKPARRIGDGSSVVVRRVGASLVPSGRPGAAMARIGGVVAATPAVLNSLHQQPHLTAVPVAAWLWASWRAGDSAQPVADPDRAERDEQDEEAEDVTPDEFVALLHQLIGTGSGVHLAQVAQHLTGDPSQTARVRNLCAAAGVAVAGGVRVPGRAVSTGIRKRDLPPLLQTPPDPFQKVPVAVVVAGQHGQQHDGQQQQQGAEDGPRIVPHPDGNPHHWAVLRD